VFIGVDGRLPSVLMGYRPPRLKLLGRLQMHQGSSCITALGRLGRSCARLGCQRRQETPFGAAKFSWSTSRQAGRWARKERVRLAAQPRDRPSVFHALSDQPSAEKKSAPALSRVSLTARDPQSTPTPLLLNLSASVCLSADFPSKTLLGFERGILHGHEYSPRVVEPINQLFEHEHAVAAPDDEWVHGVS
jgi:hypothetical protein